MNNVVVMVAGVAIGLAVLALVSLFEKKTPNRPHSQRRPPPSSSSSSRPPPSSSSSSRPPPRFSNNRSGDLCPFKAPKCINCEDSTDLVTFTPCRSSYFCDRCAMNYLEKSNVCYLCERSIDGME